MAKRGRKRPPARLAGVAELAELLQITPSSLADRRRNATFPKPIAQLRCGPIWDLDDIEDYLERRRHDPTAAYRWATQPGRLQRHYPPYSRWDRSRY